MMRGHSLYCNLLRAYRKHRIYTTLIHLRLEDGMEPIPHTYKCDTCNNEFSYSEMVRGEPKFNQTLNPSTSKT